MISQLTNCKNCISDKHDECINSESCLCSVETNHNEKIVESNQPFTPEQIAKGKELKKIWHEIYKNQSESSLKEKSYKNSDWCYVADEIQGNSDFVTLRETKKIWRYNKKEGVYEPDGDTFIDEEC